MIERRKVQSEVVRTPTRIEPDPEEPSAAARFLSAARRLPSRDHERYEHEYTSVGLRALSRIDKRQAQLKHLSVPEQCFGEDGRDATLAKLLHPSGTGLLRPQGVRVRPASLGQRVSPLEGRLASLRSFLRWKW